METPFLLYTLIFSLDMSQSKPSFIAFGATLLNGIQGPNSLYQTLKQSPIHTAMQFAVLINNPISPSLCAYIIFHKKIYSKIHQAFRRHAAALSIKKIANESLKSAAVFIGEGRKRFKSSSKFVLKN
jgi:hypothetical protein